MNEETMNVAEAKKHFSENLSQVAFGKNNFIITKRGRPMARLVPVENCGKHLSDACGWLEDDDPFFETIESIIEDRSSYISRIYGEQTIVSFRHQHFNDEYDRNTKALIKSNKEGFRDDTHRD